MTDLPRLESGAGRARRRVVLTGPECTGKTTLARHLADVFRVPLALEYARIYLEEHGPAYDYPLLLALSRAHQTYQREHVPDPVPLGVLDTDLTNYVIWSEVVFGRCDAELRRRADAEADHVYLLCAPDLPWTPDPLRENPTDRDRLFELHRAEIRRLNRPCETVDGLGPARMRNAEAAFRRLARLPGENRA
jgi:nicotinamide riboside kinase